MVRLRGLSPNSATVVALARGFVAPSRRVNTIDDTESAQRVFVSLFAPPKARRPS